jgi:hypothetical protein
MSEIINKTFRTNTKDVNYVNRDFTSLKQQLIDFTKQYYPLSYRDFSESSPGQIFIEQAAYVGDVLSPDQIRVVEDNQTVKAKSFDWELDDDQLDNMRALGLID